MAWWKKALDYISAPLSQPKTFLTKGWTASAKKVEKSRGAISRGEESGYKVIATTLGSTAVAGAGILLGAGASASASGVFARNIAKKTFTTYIPKVARSLVPKTLGGKVLGVTTTLIGVGVLKESPKARDVAKTFVTDLPKKPGKIIDFGGSIGGVIEGDSVFTKENVVEGAKAAGVVGAILGVGALVIPKIKDKLADKETPLLPVENLAPVVEPVNQIIKEKPVGVPGVPEQPKTTSIKTAPRKRYKRRVAKKVPLVRNSIKVNVNTGNYINRRGYC